MKIANSLSLIGSLALIAAGCAHRTVETSSVPVYTPTVISTPAPGSAPVVTTPPAPINPDTSLAGAVRQQLNAAPNVAPLMNNVQVSAENGTVTLRGTVPSDQQRQAIENMVRATPGVTSVNDALEVTSNTSAPIITSPSVTAPSAGATVTPPIISSPSANATVTPPSVSGGTVAPPSANATVTPPIITSPDTTYPATGRATVTTPTANMPGEVFNLHVEGLTPQDRTLAQQVLSGLRADTTLSTLFPKVDINIAEGQVVLSGTVANEQQHQAVVNAIRRSAGNNNVVDQLQVQGR